MLNVLHTFKYKYPVESNEQPSKVDKSSYQHLKINGIQICKLFSYKVFSYTLIKQWHVKTSHSQHVLLMCFDKHAVKTTEQCQCWSYTHLSEFLHDPL